MEFVVQLRKTKEEEEEEEEEKKKTKKVSPGVLQSRLYK